MSKTEMASNSRGALHSNRHGSRSPPFILIGLLVVIAILAFNYWTTSQANRELDERMTQINKQHTELHQKYLKQNNDLRLQIESKGKENTFHLQSIEELKSSAKLLKSELSNLQEELNRNKGSLDTLTKNTKICWKSSTENKTNWYDFIGPLQATLLTLACEQSHLAN